MVRIFLAQRRNGEKRCRVLKAFFAPLRLCARNILYSLALLALVFAQPQLLTAQTAQRASISIDARKVQNRISPLLYGQFLEFMFEGVKRGLYAELIRNRSFEEPPNAIGLSRD